MSAVPTSLGPSPEASAMRPRIPRRVSRVLEHGIRQRLSAQAAAVAAWLVTLVFMLLAAGVAAGGDSRESLVSIRGALGWLTWLTAGGIAMAATGQANDDDEALRDLAALRGIGAQDMVWAQARAVARRVLRLLWLPVILLNLAPLPFVRTWQGAAAAAGGLLGSLLYLVLLSVSTGCVVLAARGLAPTKSRLALAALVFVPELVRSVVPHFPSLPRVLAAAREFALHVSGWPT